jgi:glutaredoxin
MTDTTGCRAMALQLAPDIATGIGLDGRVNLRIPENLRWTTLLARALAFGLTLTAATASDAQTVYKSVGPDGKVVYSDSPPVDGKNARKLKFDNLPASPLPAPARPTVDQPKRSPSTAVPVTTAVVLYSAPWCGYCKAAKSWLDVRGIAYREIDVDTESGQVAYAQAGGGNGIPLLVAGGQRVQGFSAAAYDALFPARR